MEKLKIEGTDFTPKMEFVREERVLKIEGKLFETHKTNGLDSFGVLTRWVNKYFTESQSLTIKFRLSYFDTPSSKKIFMFMQFVDEMFHKGSDVKIIWEYEDGDDDGKLDGETFKKKLNCPFSVDKI